MTIYTSHPIRSSTLSPQFTVIIAQNLLAAKSSPSPLKPKFCKFLFLHTKQSVIVTIPKTPVCPLLPISKGAHLHCSNFDAAKFIIIDHILFYCILLHDTNVTAVEGTSDEQTFCGTDVVGVDLTIPQHHRFTVTFVTDSTDTHVGFSLVIRTSSALSGATHPYYGTTPGIEYITIINIICVVQARPG